MEPKLSIDEKYDLYEASVQSVHFEITTLNEAFQRIFNRPPLSLREDFGGTAYLAAQWVLQSEKHTGQAIDLDPVPMDYGRKKHLIDLNAEELKRVELILGNVLDDHGKKHDLIVAFNFSYFIFKKRAELLAYFKSVRLGLKKDGLFMLDIFSGLETRQELIEETEHENFSYFWDCKAYNAITEEALYAIHFQKKENGIRYRDVFTYDWRMWSIPEIRDILTEAGFTNTQVLWEGDDEDGGGNGVFVASEKEENCDSFIAYITAWG